MKKTINNSFTAILQKILSSVPLNIKTLNFIYMHQNYCISTIRLFSWYFESIVCLVLTIYILVLIQPFTKIVLTRKYRNQPQKQLSQLNDTLNDFNLASGTNVSAMENETWEQQTNGQPKEFQIFVDNATQNQVMEIKMDDKNRRAVDNAVLTVDTRINDAILTAMDKVVNSKRWDWRESNHGCVRTWKRMWSPKLCSKEFLREGWWRSAHVGFWLIRLKDKPRQEWWYS